MKIFDSMGLKVLVSKEVILLDWDMKKNEDEKGIPNYPQVATIQRREDVLELIVKYKNFINSLKNQDIGIRLYWTPNGVRGFLTSHLVDPNNESYRKPHAEEIMRVLRTDPAYRSILKTKNEYHCRISKKKDRENDFIACFWTHIGNPVILPEIIKYLKVHDALCKENRGDVQVPIKPNGIVESLIRSKMEEPWEPVHAAALDDYLEDFSLEL